MGAREDVVGYEVFCGFEPVQRGAIENLAFEGYGAEEAIEAGLAVGGEEKELAVGVIGGEVVGVADLTAVFPGVRECEVRGGEAVGCGVEEGLGGERTHSFLFSRWSMAGEPDVVSFSTSR